MESGLMNVNMQVITSNSVWISSIYSTKALLLTLTFLYVIYNLSL